LLHHQRQQRQELKAVFLVSFVDVFDNHPDNVLCQCKVLQDYDPFSFSCVVEGEAEASQFIIC